MEHVSLLIAFSAGVVTFLSPCMLPLIPAYLSYMTGLSADDISQNQNKFKLLSKSLLFVFGFTLVFIALGATATSLGQFFESHFRVLNKVSAFLLIFFGLYISGLLNLRSLNVERKISIQNKNKSMWASFVFGIVFAFAWTPCVGPILASVLILASSQQTIIHGIILLLVYSLGIGIPFILAAFLVEKFLIVFNSHKVHMHKIKVLSGIILMIIGFMMLTGFLKTTII